MDCVKDGAGSHQFGTVIPDKFVFVKVRRFPRVYVQDVYGIRQGLGKFFETLFTLAQGVFYMFAFGDVSYDTVNMRGALEC